MKIIASTLIFVVLFFLSYGGLQADSETDKTADGFKLGLLEWKLKGLETYLEEECQTVPQKDCNSALEFGLGFLDGLVEELKYQNEEEKALSKTLLEITDTTMKLKSLEKRRAYFLEHAKDCHSLIQNAKDSLGKS